MCRRSRLLFSLLFFQSTTEDLAHVGLRKLGAELDAFGNFVVREVLMEELLQFVFSKAGVFLDDEDLDYLA